MFLQTLILKLQEIKCSSLYVEIKNALNKSESEDEEIQYIIGNAGT